MESAPLASLMKALYTFTRPTPTTYVLIEQDESEGSCKEGETYPLAR